MRYSVTVFITGVTLYLLTVFISLANYTGDESDSLLTKYTRNVNLKLTNQIAQIILEHSCRAPSLAVLCSTCGELQTD